MIKLDLIIWRGLPHCLNRPHFGTTHSFFTPTYSNPHHPYGSSLPPPIPPLHPSLGHPPPSSHPSTITPPLPFRSPSTLISPPIPSVQYVHTKAVKSKQGRDERTTKNKKEKVDETIGIWYVLYNISLNEFNFM